MLNNQEISEIINDWSFFDGDVISSYKRDLSLPNKLTDDLALIIQGVRRGGKSTLLTQIPQRYNLDYQYCYYCNFEDPRLLPYINFTLLEKIVSVAREKIPKSKNCYFFFDEIQNVKGREKWLHSKLERPKKNFFIITGSNSALLSGEFATTLTGRHITVQLYPFSYHEYKNIVPDIDFKKYLQIGGFPRAISYDEPYKLLQEYFNDIIFRDILVRVNARHVDAIKHVVKMAYDSAGSELSFRKIAATTGLTVDTVKTYLRACEEAYLLFPCPYFSFSEKKRNSRQKKYYPIDPGLHLAVAKSSNNDYGKSLEIFTFLKLKQKYGQVFYWQELHKGKVDFIVLNHDNQIVPYQVTWDEPKFRHKCALDNFYQNYPQAAEVRYINKENAIELD